MSHTETVEAELAVVGGLMFCPAYHEHVGALSAAQFYDPVLGRLYTEIARRLSAGQVADAVTLKAWWQSDPFHKELPHLLMKAMEQAAPGPGHIASYAQDIRAAHARREAMRVHGEALARLQSGEDVLLVLAESEAALRALDGGGDCAGADVLEAGEAFLAAMDRPVLETGLTAIDEKLGGLHRGELVIIAGRPSMGKTALAAVIARAAAEARRAVHFASLEMPKEQLACRAISALSHRRQYGIERIQYYALRNGSNVDRGLLRELTAALPRTLIIDDRPAQTLAQLEQGARATRRRLGRLDLIVVDYLQLMTANRRDGRVNEVGEISAGLKAIAKRLDAPVVALSQLSRGVEGRDNKRPTLSDLRDSGAIEQDADVVIGCYREAYYLERDEPPSEQASAWSAWKASLERVRRDFEAIVLKQRAGPIGACKLEAHLEFDVIRDRRAS